jgi:hypothetical protein
VLKQLSRRVLPLVTGTFIALATYLYCFPDLQYGI